MNKGTPTVDEVIAMLVDDVQQGCRPRRIPRESAARVIERYRASIQRRLDGGHWDSDQERLRNAARQLGVLAGALTSLRRKEDVPDPQLEAAAVLTEENCVPPLTEGQWCKRDDS